ncbi:hypothetical protein CC1G_01409 [Coprinopsis cinerea okayama7|uniref:Uncharacterized protein n=1 Tax=Coprinopsis cinerea (strain Okayama-7 / 130 / ATCC MYA-4618 / FGSC 9003) TaxID=240176 RepID=A8NYR1_COPC7|nr:hypothetical protein CC1G_01409 [Coprinopsis cinerea okayama7\|eukprot:XP_001837497.2 hypothetical protein CC1G_01409 [Coprinopsis cinerea okayama7\
MASTLEACFNNSEESALKILHEKEKEVKAAESDVQEQQTRLDAQRAIEFYDELESDKFAKAAPAIMKSFQAHGDACAKAEREALELAMKGTTPDPEDEAPLQPYYDMLENLEQLHSDALNLESSILELASEFKEEGAADDGKEESEGSDLPWARSRLLGAINACLPVIRARISNLSMAQELIDSAQENVSISLRMESLGLE